VLQEATKAAGFPTTVWTTSLKICVWRKARKDDAFFVTLEIDGHPGAINLEIFTVEGTKECSDILFVEDY
jgi:hypothetical protein